MPEKLKVSPSLDPMVAKNLLKMVAISFLLEISLFSWFRLCGVILSILLPGTNFCKVFHNFGDCVLLSSIAFW